MAKHQPPILKQNSSESTDFLTLHNNIEHLKMLRLTPDSSDHHAEALTLVSPYSEKVPSLNLLIHGWLIDSPTLQ